VSPRAEREAAVAERREREPEGSAELTRAIAAIVDDKKGERIVAIDVRELVSYTDYLVIATARNERQAKAIADEVYARLKHERGLLPARTEGEGEARWVLLDYVDVIVHVQHAEERVYYSLERIWKDCPAIELPDEVRRGRDGRTQNGRADGVAGAAS
jgi:ribosome-associated protein